MIINISDLQLLMSCFWRTISAHWLNMDYDDNINKSFTYPLKRFKFLKPSYEYNNMLDVCQHSNSLKTEELVNVLDIKLIGNTNDYEGEMLIKFRDQLMQNKQKCNQLESNSFWW